jgi:hypothetical protein
VRNVGGQLKLRSWLTGIALLAGAFGPVAAPGVACAASSAALVVATGSNNYTYCVELGESSVNGIQLIQKASQQHALQYKLGYGGKAVCMLANVGAGGNDCFGKHPYFWGFWRGDGSGGWNWSSTGAANIAVDAGDIQGWSWGTGDSGSSHPPPPQATYESVCGVTPSPEPSTKPGGPKGGGGAGGDKPGGSPGGGYGSGPNTQPGGSPAAGDPGDGAANESKKGDGKDSKKESKRGDEGRDGRDQNAASPSPSASATPVASSDPAAARAPDSDAPAAAFVALGAAAVLGTAGVLLIRRRRDTG